MSYINGEIRILYIKKEGVFYPIGCLTSNSFSETVDMLPTTTRDNPNGWKTSRPTRQKYSISFDGLITDNIVVSGKVTYNDLKLFKRGRTLIEWKVIDGVLDDESGFAYITDLSDSANIDEFVSFNGSLIGNINPN